MSKDNREELNKILKGYSPRNTHCNTVIQDHQRKLIVEEIMDVIAEVTIDSGADVCEWKPKLRAFLEGLQMSNIDGLMNCTKEEFRNVGEIMAQNIISKTNNY